MVVYLYMWLLVADCLTLLVVLVCGVTLQIGGLVAAFCCGYFGGLALGLGVYSGWFDLRLGLVAVFDDVRIPSV